MKILFLTLLLTLFFGGVTIIEAKTQKVVKVQINQQKKVIGTKFTVKFLEMVEDSRCPSDTNCIWAGNAKIKIRVTKSGKTAKIFELNTNLADKTVVFEGHEFKLTALTPAPRSNIRINRNGYTATLTVTKTAT